MIANIIATAIILLTLYLLTCAARATVHKASQQKKALWSDVAEEMLRPVSQLAGKLSSKLRKTP